MFLPRQWRGRPRRRWYETAGILIVGRVGLGAARSERQQDQGEKGGAHRVTTRSPAPRLRCGNSDTVVRFWLMTISEEQGQQAQLAKSAHVMTASAVTQADNADRRTELAMDRTVLAAERTYAAWVRTGLAALASGTARGRCLMVSYQIGLP